MKMLNVKGIVKGTSVSVIISFIFILALSVISYFVDVSNTVIDTAIFAGVVIGVFAGAYAVGKGSEQKKAINGLSVGLVYFAVLVLLSLLLNKGIAFNLKFIILALCCIIASLIGGIKSID